MISLCIWATEGLGCSEMGVISSKNRFRGSKKIQSTLCTTWRKGQSTKWQGKDAWNKGMCRVSCSKGSLPSHLLSLWPCQSCSVPAVLGGHGFTFCVYSFCQCFICYSQRDAPTFLLPWRRLNLNMAFLSSYCEHSVATAQYRSSNCTSSFLVLIIDSVWKTCTFYFGK